MMRIEKTITKKIAALVATVIIGTTLGTLFICPVKAKADEPYQIIDFKDVKTLDIPEDSFWPYKDKWYNTQEEAFRSADMKFYHHAELRDRYILFYGWTTHGCTILPPYFLTEKDGKYAVVYFNSYDNKCYLRSCYEGYCK